MPDIKKNQEYTIQITGMTHEGQGVGKIDNFTVFVDQALEGETVLVRIIKINKSFAVGKLMQVVESSNGRIEPFCPVYKRCGGCRLQHMDYETQLKFKTDTVRENIKRIGKLEDVDVHSTIGMQDALGYRNKAQFPVGMGKEDVAIGFYAPRSHEIIDHARCGIQHEISDKVKELIREFLQKHHIEVYNEATGKGLVRHIMTRTGFKTGEAMVVIVINGKSLPKQDQLIDMLLTRFPEIKSIYLNINTKKTNVILGEKSVKIYGKETIADFIGRYQFNISPHSFFQVNPIQTEVLYSKALEYAGITGNEKVFDLYCGIGTISLFLSEKAKKVYGVEVVEAAVQDAQKNAEINQVANVEFICGAAEKVIPELYGQGVRADVVVVDPPRKGCDEVLLDTLVSMQPQRMVYVSCNPGTLARDLNYLDQYGYKAVEVQPVDMFPWTAHVESVVRIERV